MTRLTVGIDPGLTRTGVAYLSERGFSEVHTYSSESGHPTGYRVNSMVHCIFSTIMEAAKDHDEVVVAIEDNHFTSGKSAQSALKQRELIGALAAEAAKREYEVVRVAPTEAKKAMVGNGRADKRDMANAAMAYMDISDMSKTDREAVADAMGVCLAAAAKIKEAL